MTRSEMISSVDWDNVQSGEVVPILDQIQDVSTFQKEDREWHRDFNMECFVITDHIDFILSETFGNHERRQ